MSETKYTWDMLSDVHKEILTIVNEMLQSDDERFTASRFYPGLGGRDAIMRREFQTLADEGYFNYDPFDATYRFTPAGRALVEAASDEPAYNPAADVQREVEGGWQAAEKDATDKPYTNCKICGAEDALLVESIYYFCPTHMQELVLHQADEIKRQKALIEDWNPVIQVVAKLAGGDEQPVTTDEAVAEIERLQAELETLKNIGQLWTSTNDSRNVVLIENADLSQRVADLQAANVELTTRNRALVERAEKAEAGASATCKVLQQLAMAVTTWHKPDGTTEIVIAPNFSQSDIHRWVADARELLSGEGNAGADLLARLQAAEAERDAVVFVRNNAIALLRPFADAVDYDADDGRYLVAFMSASKEPYIAAYHFIEACNETE